MTAWLLYMIVVSDNKRIAKNTMFLYFRMILIMGVTLYTSRVILDKLGIEDYGLFNVVGSAVAILSFLNGTLSIGTSRFLTYELGRGDVDRLNRTFSTALYAHVILALIVVLLMETGGLWFLYNKMVIPPERFTACLWVFHLSILTTVVSITQVPYTASIMAHERMGVYAYISIFEVFAKLGICYLITRTEIDRLISYAILVFVVQTLVAAIYRIYGIRRFSECKFSLIFDKQILRSLLSFSGWNIMANISNTLGQQGVLILINLFFAPAVAAAQAISLQVSNAMSQFINNFRTAINPQIIKLYAFGDREGSKKLTLDTTIYSFDLTLLIGLPAVFVMNTLMKIWLVEVPIYAIAFTQWFIIRQIIGTFSASFYTPMMAANKMKTNSMAAVFLGIGEFILLYFVLKIGGGPMWIQYLGVIVTIGFSMMVKPYILIKQIDYSLKDILVCYYICFRVLLLSLLFSIPIVFFLEETVLMSILKALLIAISVIFSSYIHLKSEEKMKLKKVIESRLIQAIRRK